MLILYNSSMSEDPTDYLCDKPAALSSNGTYYNDLYYSCLNASVNLIEATASMGRYTQSLSSLGFNSSSNITIPNQSFVGETYLNLELPNVVANQTLCRGWGLAIIDSIQFLIGSSNTSSLTMSGQTLFQALMAQCTTSEKRSEMLRLAGEEVLQPLVQAPGEDAPRIRASVLLPLPWSTLCDKLYLDSSLLSNPIIVTIKFKDSAAIFGGTGVRPGSFLSAALTYRQMDLSNTTQSLKHVLLREPMMMYSYPFIHHQYFITPPFAGATQASGSICQVNLQGFINSDLTGISLYVLRQSDAASTGGNSPSPFNTDPITNIRILYNGVPLYTTPGDSWKLVNMLGGQNASYIQNSVIRPGTVAPFNSDPVDSYVLFVDFSRIRAACFHEHYSNVFRISNQTLQVQFNTRFDSATTYICYATYFYNGCVEFQNGTSMIRLE